MANNDKDKKDSKNQDPHSSTTGEKLAEALKKIISSGSPAEISKEIISTVFGQAVKAKDDITHKVSTEMIALVQKIDFVKDLEVKRLSEVQFQDLKKDKHVLLIPEIIDRNLPFYLISG